MLQFGRHVKQTDAIQVIMDEGLGAKSPGTGQFSQFLEKNNHFKAI